MSSIIPSLSHNPPPPHPLPLLRPEITRLRALTTWETTVSLRFHYRQQWSMNRPHITSVNQAVWCTPKTSIEGLNETIVLRPASVAPPQGAYVLQHPQATRLAARRARGIWGAKGHSSATVGPWGAAADSNGSRSSRITQPRDRCRI